MKRIILLLFLLNVIIFNVFSQKQINIGKSCSYYGEKMPTQAYTFSSDNEAIAALKLITDASGLSPNFTIVAGNVPNACATMIYNAKTKGLERYIIYNQTFMYNISQKINYWASVNILAHEVGHHLNGHSLQLGGSRPSIELEADKFSGFILAKLGATLEEAQSAINSLASEQGSSTHPPKSARLAAIANGWYQNSSNVSRGNISKISLATKPRALFYGEQNLREQVFIKKTSTTQFDLISEKGYTFQKFEYNVIDINDNFKLFWFPDWSSYGCIDRFNYLPLNQLIQCLQGNAPTSIFNETYFERHPGNYISLILPNKSFMLFCDGKVKNSAKFLSAQKDYIEYHFYNGNKYVKFSIYNDSVDEAHEKNKIIVGHPFFKEANL